MHTVKVLLIDDDEAFCHLFKVNLEENKSWINIDCAIATSIEDPQVAANNKDVYLVDHNFYGRPMAPEIVEKIKAGGAARIFVISKFGDYSLLKKLLNMGIDGFIDKDEINYPEFVRFCESIAQTKISLESITRKLDRLDEN